MATKPSCVLPLPDAQATHTLGVWLGRRLPQGTVLLLEGTLGSGKTTLVKGLGQGLGITEDIDSPTFTLINEYLDGRLPLYHADLYRLEGTAVAGLYLDVYWEGVDFAPGIVAIEWAERLGDRPPHALTLALTHQPQGRQAVITPATASQGELIGSLSTDALLVDEV